MGSLFCAGLTCLVRPQVRVSLSQSRSASTAPSVSVGFVVPHSVATAPSGPVWAASLVPTAAFQLEQHPQVRLDRPNAISFRLKGAFGICPLCLVLFRRCPRVLWRSHRAPTWPERHRRVRFMAHPGCVGLVRASFYFNGPRLMNGLVASCPTSTMPSCPVRLLESNLIPPQPRLSRKCDPKSVRDVVGVADPGCHVVGEAMDRAEGDAVVISRPVGDQVCDVWWTEPTRRQLSPETCWRPVTQKVQKSLNIL
jgi:hypothetical protein